MSGISDLISKVATELQGMAVPLGVLALVLLGASLIIGFKSPQEGKQSFFYICLGLALIAGATSIASFIYGS